MRLRFLLPLIFLNAFALYAEPQPVPRMQALPLPHAQVSFERDGVEIARYHFGDDNSRPFIYPVIGPSGRPLTRMGHPHDPVTHSHHNSVWISHQFVNGVNFWGDQPPGPRIAHQRVERLYDSDDTAFVEVLNHWLDKDGKLQMAERRRIGAQPLENGEWLLLLDVQFEVGAEPVTIAPSAFGMAAVRMAKTIGVNDGGGTIRNSEGGVDEAGCFRKPARWCDYSGPITNTASEGITLMDHPSNPTHPVPFHVRNDGWMGASLTFAQELKIDPGTPLRLRYALYIHAGIAEPAKIDAQWQAFARTGWMEFPTKRK